MSYDLRLELNGWGEIIWDDKVFKKNQYTIIFPFFSLLKLSLKVVKLKDCQ